MGEIKKKCATRCWVPHCEKSKPNTLVKYVTSPSNPESFVTLFDLPIFPGATVTERLACSPPTKAIRVQSSTGSLRIFACENRASRYRWSTGFLRDLPFPPLSLNMREGGKTRTVFRVLQTRLQGTLAKSCNEPLMHQLKRRDYCGTPEWAAQGRKLQREKDTSLSPNTLNTNRILRLLLRIMSDVTDNRLLEGVAMVKFECRFAALPLYGSTYALSFATCYARQCKCAWTLAEHPLCCVFRYHRTQSANLRNGCSQNIYGPLSLMEAVTPLTHRPRRPHISHAPASGSPTSNFVAYKKCMQQAPTINNLTNMGRFCLRGNSLDSHSHSGGHWFDSRSSHPDFVFPWFPEITPDECCDGSIIKASADSFPFLPYSLLPVRANDLAVDETSLSIDTKDSQHISTVHTNQFGVVATATPLLMLGSSDTFSSLSIDTKDSQHISTVHTNQFGAAVPLRARHSPPTKANWEGFLGDLAFPPLLHCGVAPHSPHFTRISSQDSMRPILQAAQITPLTNLYTDISGDSSPFLLQPFHELSNGFWPRLTSPHPAIQFVPKMFYRVEVGALGGPVQSANIAVGVPLHNCSPPANANRIQSATGSLPGFAQLGIVSNDAADRRVFSGISHFPRPFIPALFHTHLASPSSALKTSMLRTSQICSLPLSLNGRYGNYTEIFFVSQVSFRITILFECSPTEKVLALRRDRESALTQTFWAIDDPMPQAIILMLIEDSPAHNRMVLHLNMLVSFLPLRQSRDPVKCILNGSCVTRAVSNALRLDSDELGILRLDSGGARESSDRNCRVYPKVLGSYDHQLF
ncbi:hypothetical protein PR048_029079 [Dryococelus australis]|uniref:Uncharacterized protein n=1 Tax=Dryococelus australis TaxID=614101 RepID=A0ABQ9GCE4_9NEOP|nr:hypothetical protein PR048_029079 [Dryococelus australis]